MKKAFIPIMAVIFLAVCANAENTARGPRELVKKEKKLEDVKKRLKETKTRISKISRTESDMLGELERINGRLKENRGRLKRVEGDLKEMAARIKETDVNVARLTEEMRFLTARLRKRLRAIYKMRIGISPVAFSPLSLDGAARSRYITSIMDSDRKLVNRAEETLSRLGSEKKRLKVLEERLYAARAVARLEKAEMEKGLRQRESLLLSVKKEKDRYLAMEMELNAAEKDLLNVIEKLRDEEGWVEGESGFASMRGKLKMPVTGRVVSRYGKVTHPKFNTVTFNNGIVIEAPFGSPAKNVYEGKVAYVGRLKGYGEVVIIDHGGGFYTLFAYLSEVLKKRGEGVEKGDVVGLVGDSSPTSVTGLYFEVRQKGVPRDPLAWVVER